MVPQGRDARVKGKTHTFETDHLMADLGRRTVRGGALAIAAQMLSMAIQFGSMAILARILQPSDFGLVAMAAAVTGFVAMFTELGLSQATVQRDRIDQNLASAFFQINLLGGVAVTLVIIALAPLSAIFFKDSRLTNLVIAMAMTVPVLSASRQHAALLNRGMKWKSLHAINLSSQLVASMAAIALVIWYDWSYWALVAQAWVSAIMLTVGLWLACPWKPGRVTDWKAAREPLHFGLHLSAFSFINYFHRQFDDVLVGRRWGAEALGYYTRAYGLLMMPLKLINGPAGSAVMPALSRLKNEPLRWRNAYLDALGTVTLAASGIAAALHIAAHPIVALAYGPQWTVSADVFALLSISLLGSCSVNTVGWIYMSLGRTAAMSKWGLFATPVIVLAVLLGLPYGIKGVAACYSGIIILLILPAFWVAIRETPLTGMDIARTISPGMVASLLTTVASYSLYGRLTDVSELIALGKIATLGTIYLVTAQAIAYLVRTTSPADLFCALLHRLSAKTNCDPAI